MGLGIGALALGAVLLLLGTDSLHKGIAALASALGLGSYATAFVMFAAGGVVPVAALAIAALHGGQGGLAFGTMVGANVGSFCVIPAFAIACAPFVPRWRLARRLSWLYAIFVAIFAILAWDGRLAAFDAVLLLVLGGALLVVLLEHAPRELAEVRTSLAAGAATRGGAWRTAVRLALGGVLTGFGAYEASGAATALASAWGWSAASAGLILLGPVVVLTDLAGILLAALRGQADPVLAALLAGGAFRLTVSLAPALFWHPLDVPLAVLPVWMPALALPVLALSVVRRGPSARSRATAYALAGVWLVLLVWQGLHAGAVAAA